MPALYANQHHGNRRATSELSTIGKHQMSSESRAEDNGCQQIANRNLMQFFVASPALVLPCEHVQAVAGSAGTIATLPIDLLCPMFSLLSCLSSLA